MNCEHGYPFHDFCLPGGVLVGRVADVVDGCIHIHADGGGVAAALLPRRP